MVQKLQRQNPTDKLSVRSSNWTSFVRSNKCTNQEIGTWYLQKNILQYSYIPSAYFTSVLLDTYISIPSQIFFYTLNRLICVKRKYSTRYLPGIRNDFSHEYLNMTRPYVFKQDIISMYLNMGFHVRSWRRFPDQEIF